MYTLTRVAKCPLLWTLQGMSGDVVLRYYGHHDVILFPQVVAKLTDTQRLVHSMDSLVLVKLDAVPSALTTRPAATMKEMGDMLVRVTALKKRRDIIKKNLQAVGPAAYAAFQVDVSAQFHKMAMMYIYHYIKNTATERRRCQARLRTRQTQFQTWFAHMTIEAPITSDPITTATTTSTTADMEQIDPSSTDTPPIDLASTPPPPDDVEMINTDDPPLALPEHATLSTPPPSSSPPPPSIRDVQPQPPSPPSKVTSPVAAMSVDEPPPSPVELVRRNPAKARIFHWHVEKLVVACRVANPDMPDARDVAEIIKEAMDYLMPLDCFSANQLNQTMLAIEADLATRDAPAIRRLVAPLALSPYLTSFFPTPMKKAVKLRALNRRGCRVHFSDTLHHVKHFHFDDAPNAVRQALVHMNNDNIREGAPDLPRRPSLPSQPFVDSRPHKYIRLG
ncbi:hypothetical protein B5M09_004260 [Aphanomyces astaci]|uniref:Uncharacterized protein n=1 Tax=Aphanomyces astaci TaxID=112090 RepID=A0A425DLP2_APHAT|nr:hypothetical protein B5M09_004260 [Aphanomyces astaci]